MRSGQSKVLQKPSKSQGTNALFIDVELIDGHLLISGQAVIVLEGRLLV